MDKNKLSKLKKLNYTIKKCCGLCAHAQFKFKQVGNVWGDCKIHVYDHLKHSEHTRQLSINQFGYCEDFEWNEFLVNNSWMEFLEK